MSEPRNWIDAVEARGACSEALAWLRDHGFATPQEAWNACPRGDWMCWLVGAFGDAPAQAAYDEAVTTARAAYREAVATAQAAYREAVATARAAYREAVATARAACAEAVATAQAAYDEAVAHAQAAHADAIRAVVPVCPVEVSDE